MSKTWKPTPHPVLALPTAEEAVRMGAAEFALRYGRGGKREQIIASERAAPLTHGWQPPIWRVCDALLGFPWVPEEEASAYRKLLGFRKPVDILLINGGQRGAKTTYGINRMMRVLMGGDGRNAWCFHSNLDMSIQWHQAVAYNYLPAHLRRKIQTSTTYIAFKQHTGFSDQKFILPTRSGGDDPDVPTIPGSTCKFRTYEQDATSLEGANLDYIFCDELVPPDVVRTLALRIAERQGKMVIGFTPVEGYSETVREFQDGAAVVRESIAYLCPRDGGPPALAEALGLAQWELEEQERAQVERRICIAPASRPEQCRLWLEGKSGQVPVPEGRAFELVPRVMKCVDPEEKRAVVFFHSSDNPFGNPRSVYSTIARGTRAFVQERFYGVATKTLSARFPRFNPKVHVIAPDAVPQEGTNYHIVDPAAGRNFWMVWIRVTPNANYLYREWPGAYPIEGVGVPGPWALPDGKLPDGRVGPAQTPFGFSYARYKLEIARLEGWSDWKEADKTRLTLGTGSSGGPANIEEWVTPWDEANGADEIVAERFMDSRFASAAREQGDQPVTLLTKFDDLGLRFTPAPGDPILEGISDINDALDYDADRPVDYFNSPRLFISADCKNTIYALQTWTGLDGARLGAETRISQKGATKDPIDALRYFFRAGCGYIEPVPAGTSAYKGGGY